MEAEIVDCINKPEMPYGSWSTNHSWAEVSASDVVGLPSLFKQNWKTTAIINIDDKGHSPALVLPKIIAGW